LYYKLNNMTIKILFVCLLILLLLNAIYLLIFSIAGAVLPLKKKLVYRNIEGKKFLILIPGYKEDAVIINSVKSVMAQNYPRSLFHCAVIADSFDNKTLEKIRTFGAEAFELPPIENRSKANAIQVYLSKVFVEYDACIILDADNVVESDLLLRSEVYLQNGEKIIQAKRVAKNEVNSMSRLDALSEIINNHIFRKGQRALGFSASLIGSGMIIDMVIFREVMKDMHVFSGFDKEMEIRILKKHHTIEYAESIKIYDEKVAEQNVYVNQRRRWTYAQIFFLRKNFINAFVELFRSGNADYFNKILQFALLPRIIGLGFSVICLIISPMLGATLFFLSLALLFSYILSFYLAIKDDIKLNELLNLSLKLPRAFWGMAKAILTSNKASKVFIHTPHNN